jgi:hypothetical protein
MTLTMRQRELMDYLACFIAERGYSPSYEEIGAHFQYRSLSTVHEHIRNLAARGLLRVGGKRARSIEILRTDDRARAYASVFPPPEWLRERCCDYPVPPVAAPEAGCLAATRAYRERWSALRGEMVPGDELWTFRAPDPGWACSAGRAGYALVRAGRVVDGVVTHDQLVDGGAGTIPE